MRGKVLFLLLAILFFPLTQAHAYIDPGAGSIFLQVVIGAVIGAFYTFRKFISDLFRKIFKK